MQLDNQNYSLLVFKIVEQRNRFHAIIISSNFKCMIHNLKSGMSESQFIEWYVESQLIEWYVRITIYKVVCLNHNL